MADISCTSPLGIERERLCIQASATLAALPSVAQFILCGDTESLAHAGRTFGVPIPSSACRSEVVNDRAVLWLGPDEFLLLAPAADARDIDGSLNAALKDLPASLVDVTHRNVLIGLSGPCAASVLNAGCPIDLNHEQFPVGACTRTIMAKAQIVLWRREAESFTIAVWRSFASYTWQYLDEARSAWS